MQNRSTQLRELREFRAAMDRRIAGLKTSAEARGGNLNMAEQGEFRAAEIARRHADDVIRITEARGDAISLGGDAEFRRFAFGEGLRAHVRGAALPQEVRAALNEATGSDGGYLAPIEFDDELVIQNLPYAPIEALASYFTSPGGSGTLKVAGAEQQTTASRIAEAGSIPEAEPTFVGFDLAGFKYGGVAKLSEEWLLDSAIDPVSALTTLGTRGIQVAIDADLATGNGSGNPEGLTQNTVGVTAVSATAVTAAEVRDLFFSVTPGYRANASWIMADATFKALAELVDTGTGDALRGFVHFADSPSEPDTLLGRPVYPDENFPAMTAGNNAIYFGNVEANLLVRRIGSTVVKVLNDLYAGDGQVGFRIHRRIDSKIIDPAAGRVLQMAAA